MISLSFIPKDKLVVVKDSGDIDFLSLYKAIREWEASEEGIVFPVILEGSGNVQLPGGNRTPRCMIFLDGWRLKSDQDIAILNGYLTGRKGNSYYYPVANESHDKIKLLSTEKEESELVPTEAQKRYAFEQGKIFGQDWEIVIEPRLLVQRKQTASERKHKVFGLYWFLKHEWLRNSELRKFSFPIKGDNRIWTKGLIREWEWSPQWEIPKNDLRYLEDGPLALMGKILIPPLMLEVEDQNQDQRYAKIRGFSNIFSYLVTRLTSILRRGGRRVSTSEALRMSVTIGVVTVLSHEYAAVKCQLDHIREYVGTEGRKNLTYEIGTLPAFDGGSHTIALTMSKMGTNPATIRTMALIHEFPNLQEIIMVGIAGAVPNPKDPETHVRLGDIVVSGEQGVVQYDFIKTPGDAMIENRHRPRPPSAQLIEAFRKLHSDYLLGIQPWMELLNRAPSVLHTRPPVEMDKLADSNNPTFFCEHPKDDSRHPDEPKIFMGTIGAANNLLKNAKQRDQLRDRFNIRAIEMESSGISDATDENDCSYFIIRGTCDYCDENKNKDWQNYAAAISGAYLRALLSKVPSLRELI